ncbi:spore germination protein [Paenibacillus sp. TRM 82003]|nr:spore germination protein [Paenibacillus sp. TRM 82003]
MQQRLADNVDLQFSDIEAQDGTRGLLVYFESVVDKKQLEDYIVVPMLKGQAVSNAKVRSLTDLETISVALVSGEAALFLEGRTEASLLEVKGGTRRGIEEPATEAVIRGPREGFNESLQTNIGLIRHRLKTPDLKTVKYVVGEQTRTNVVLAYIDGIADDSVIREAKRRIEDIKIDAVLESGYIEEMIEDQPFSPFPQLQYTERPDTAVAQLLEGRFAIFTDGTPFVIMGPVTFWQFLQANEDYYERYLIASAVRWLRLLFIFVALFLPSLYVAITTFHQDMLPTNLLLSIAGARENIPFPALIEALIMEISFEALREAGVRLPKTIGQAVSILGALVIGQAAVEAGIVSAPMVIIVSMTGIASFSIPRFNMAISIRMLRFPLMVLAGTFGLFGIVIGTMWIAVHLCNLRSFGVPYLSGVAPYQKGEAKDIFVRAPWWKLRMRQRSIAHRNRRRLASDMKPEP